jgi:hypothetical protein
MERDKEEKPQWKKVGGGSFTMGKQIIKPGQIFSAYPEEIPKSFRDLVQSVDGKVTFTTAKEAPLATTYPVTKVTYTITPESKLTVVPKGNSNTWFNVVDKDGNVQNEKGLRKADAEALCGTEVTYNLMSPEGKKLNDKSLTKTEAEELLKALEK